MWAPERRCQACSNVFPIDAVEDEDADEDDALGDRVLEGGQAHGGEAALDDLEGEGREEYAADAVILAMGEGRKAAASINEYLAQ